MVNISQRRAIKRWSSITPALREALFSTVHADYVAKICETEHIPEEKENEIAGRAGYVLMGFLHPEDLGEELQEAVGLAPQTAKTIADSINQRIFAPLRADIDKVYNPVTATKTVQDIGPAPRTPQTASVSSQTMSGGPMILGAMPMSGNQAKAAPPPMAPKGKLADVGWSRSSPQQPVVKLTQTSTPSAAQNPVIQRVPPPAYKSPVVQAKGLGEFERIAQQSTKVPSAPSASVPSTPAPVIIHQDTAFNPTQKSPDFHLQVPQENFSIQKPSAPVVRPAVLELGKATPPQAPKPQTSTPRVIHYSEYQPPASLASQPSTPKPSTPPQGPRKVTEVTAPPMPSTPSTPPTQNKVIYKDYTEPPPKPPQR